MKIPNHMPHLKGFRYPRETIAYAVWVYRRFALSTADVEDLLAERDVIVSQEAIRGKKHWLWRAIDANGHVLDIIVQTHRNAKAAKRFLQRLVARFGEPRVVITPSRDIAGQRTNCAAIHCTAVEYLHSMRVANRSKYSPRTLTTAPTKA